MYRIDKAVIPAGLIRSAKTYSLLVDDNGFYIIHTGPAGRHVQTRGSINAAVVDFVRSSQGKKVSEGEARIAAVSLEQLKQEKGNAFIPKSEIKNVEVSKNIYNENVLDIETTHKKWKFHFFFVENSEEVKQFAARLK
ncbi:MAG: hypothetical protein WCW16_04525 [Candidatus Magasanikbacteria bacterium]